MTNSQRRTQTPRRTLTRFRPQVHSLEGRLAMSGFGVDGFDLTGNGPETVQVGVGDNSGSETFSTTEGSDFTGSASSVSPAITSVSPAPGSTSTQRVGSISVTFLQEIDPFSIGFGDFTLSRFGETADANATITPTSYELDPTDPTNHRVVLKFDSPLSVGSYRLTFSGSSFLMGTDGSMISSGVDQDVTDFQIQKAALNLSQAIDLGTASATETVRAGQLDLATDPDATAVYRFNLSAGSNWNLNLSLSAQRDGGTLDTAFSLLDAQGQPIIAVDRGNVDAPLDPTLTQSLDGGVYYLVVTGRQVSGGTDNTFRIHLAASQAVTTTTVTNFGLDYANPFSTRPTGLTFHFSGPLDSETLFQSPATTLEVVDAQGNASPILLSGISLDRTAASFFFSKPIAAGAYQIRVSSGLSLADLAGRPVVGLDPSSASLGTFGIDSIDSTENDLGVIQPVANASLKDDFTLAPGETQKRTLTVLLGGSHTLTFPNGLNGSQVVLLDASGQPINSVQETNGEGESPNIVHLGFVLKPGTYTLSFTNPNSTSTEVNFLIGVRIGLASSFNDGVLGQGSGVGSQIIPKRTEPSSTPGKIGDTGNTGGTGIINNPGHTGTNNNAGSTGSEFGKDVRDLRVQPLLLAPSPSQPRSTPNLAPGDGSASAILVGSGPVGLPTANFDVIQVVGSGEGFAGLALASSQPGIPNGLLVVPESLSSRQVGLGSLFSNAPDPGADVSSPAQNEIAVASDREILESLRRNMGHDIQIDSGWFDRSVAWLGEFFTEPQAASSPSIAAVAAGAVGGAENQVTEGDSRVVSASFTAPALLVTVGLAAYRSRTSLKHWAKRKPTSILSGPHHRFQPRCRSGIGR